MPNAEILSDLLAANWILKNDWSGAQCDFILAWIQHITVNSTVFHRHINGL